MLFVASGWWAIGRRTGASEVPLVSVAEIVAQVAPVPVLVGEARLIGVPWGEIVSIESLDAVDPPLPAERDTPLMLSLPVGRYRAVLSNPLAEQGRVCYFEVSSGAVSQCRVQFFQQTAEEHFAEAGWWR